ncbi:class I SAM-dependent methyltransferase [Arthrobacter antibioticus]|uniref:class I SAM-dependent methyltransferase n=1 Tax=Arthrobacter sp. H35-MC1 TaxID=3046203 RepID=UPI0024B908F6|nr:class I SAM-dependent methyltransferase [Arthrobacter sp. H35-MC1]MDJ0315819.1 class I SAM-dependent methyltransferase [Arthrobacter sp. H35-MC1]
MNQIHSAPTVSSSNSVLHNDARPAWPAEVVSWLMGSPSRSQQLAVLDLGAGTGLGTRTIATLGHDVTAVDTSKDMLSVLRTICEELPSGVADRISTASGSAERIPLGNRSVDSIVCLQAWHWVDPKRAIAECDRVMTPNGMMGIAWHTWDRASQWVKELAAIVEPDGTPADQTQSVPGEFAGRGAFIRKDFPFIYELSVDQLVQLASSWAYVVQRSDHVDVFGKIRRLGEQAASCDTGLVRFPHITAAFRLQRPGSGVMG